MTILHQVLANRHFRSRGSLQEELAHFVAALPRSDGPTSLTVPANTLLKRKMDMPSNYDIVKDHYAASERQDIAAMFTHVSETVEWTEMAGFPCAGTWIGPQAVIDHVFKVLGSAWENYRFALEHLVDGGDIIVGIGTYSGTYRATRKLMQARVAHVWRLDAGKVVKFEQFTDTLLVTNAMR